MRRIPETDDPATTQVTCADGSTELVGGEELEAVAAFYDDRRSAPKGRTMSQMMRREYEMSQDQHDSVLEASKPTPCLYLSGGQPMGPSPQDNANAAWRRLGKEMGFEWNTVRRIPGCCEKHFTAVPTPTREAVTP